MASLWPPGAGRLGPPTKCAQAGRFSPWLEAASITHLERTAQLSYTAPAAYSLMARVTNYQTVSETALLDPLTGTLNPDLQPYQRLPEVRVDALTPNPLWGMHLGITGQYLQNFELSLSYNAFFGDVNKHIGNSTLKANPYVDHDYLALSAKFNL